MFFFTFFRSKKHGTHYNFSLYGIEPIQYATIHLNETTHSLEAYGELLENLKVSLLCHNVAYLAFIISFKNLNINCFTICLFYNYEMYGNGILTSS